LGSFYIGITAALAYIGVYFVRTPIFFIDLGYYHGVNYKTILSATNLIGLILSKPLAMGLLSVIGVKHRLLILCLLLIFGMLFTAVPIAVYPELKVLQIIGMLLGSLLISPTYGLTVLYIEGRTKTELILCIFVLSFLFGGGIVRAVCALLLQYMSPNYIPLIAGFIGVAPAVISYIFLNMSPLPNGKDITHRVKRKKMTIFDQLSFIWKYCPGVFVILLNNMMVLTTRNIKEYFSPEIYKFALGPIRPESYIIVDIPGGVISVLSLLIIQRIKNNEHAFYLGSIIVVLSGALIGINTFLFDRNVIPGLVWLLTSFAGLWPCYIIPISGTTFDRLIAITNTHGTVVFMLFLLDMVGYMATLVVLTVTMFYSIDIGPFFVWLCYLTAIIAIGSYLFSIFYFYAIFKKQKKDVAILPLIGESE